MAENEGEWSPWGGEEEELEQPLINPVDDLQGHLGGKMDENGMTEILVGGRASRAVQYVAAFSATMGALAMGAVLGYSSPAGTLLMANTTSSSLTLTKEQNTWFSSSVNIGALAGGPVGAMCLNTLGRRGTMMSSTLPFVGGWLLIVFAQNFAMLLVGRIMTGLCIGVTSLAAPTFIAEYASPDIRGILGSGFQLMVTIGVLFVYGAGAIVSSWKTLAGICIVPVLAYFVLMIFVKESPSFLLSKGKEEEAAAALQYFRGKSYNIQTELDMMRVSVQEAQEKRTSIKDLMKPCVYKPILISLSLMFFQQFSGINGLLFNLNKIFADSGSSLSDDVSSILVAVVQVVATFMAAALMDRAGRKLLLIISAAIMTLSLVAIGEFFYMKSMDATWAVQTLGWLPLVSLIIFISAFSIGYGPIPWLMMGELFSSDVKEVAAGLATMCNWTSSLVVTSIFVSLQENLHTYGAYWLFSSICIVNLVFCVTLVPETKGKTLDEITALFGAPNGNQGVRESDATDC